VFYPKAIQLYPDEFPGKSPDDCPRDIGKTKLVRFSNSCCCYQCGFGRAVEKKCANAEHPDSYGHYREASVTAIKHHWWWKVCMHVSRGVFDLVLDIKIAGLLFIKYLPIYCCSCFLLKLCAVV